MRSEAAMGQAVSAQGDALTLTNPMLGRAMGGALGLLDGLSGFLEQSVAR